LSCWELFEDQTQEYKNDVLKCNDKTLLVSIEAGITDGWQKYTGRNGFNAGINTFGESVELVNGVEKTFVVNYLGHFVLVNRLMPLMNQAQESRIVHVGSMSAYVQAPAVGIDFDNLRGEGVFDSQEAYGRSKLANALFSLELAARLEGSSVTSNVIHPGLVKTNIARTAPIVLRKGFD
jgi:NAD(P)-dependent dehydrogenase (short-subunit alcohol dehydrogenase family)